jgi:hypothetical protein
MLVQRSRIIFMRLKGFDAAPAPTLLCRIASKNFGRKQNLTLFFIYCFYLFMIYDLFIVFVGNCCKRE